MLLVIGVVVAFIGVLASFWIFNLVRTEYAFAAPDSWSEDCLGDKETAAELLDWEEAGRSRPAVSRLEPSYNSYQCEWRWAGDSSLAGGQVLTITIEVNDDREYGPEATESDPDAAVEGWRTDYESLDGWEHGICRDRFLSTADSEYECIASDSNLLVSVANRNLAGASDLDPKYFGPGGVSVEELAVELGALVQPAFRD
jgi:hypothetical protein